LTVGADELESNKQKQKRKKRKTRDNVAWDVFVCVCGSVVKYRSCAVPFLDQLLLVVTLFIAQEVLKRFTLLQLLHQAAII